VLLSFHPSMDGVLRCPDDITRRKPGEVRRSQLRTGRDQCRFNTLQESMGKVAWDYPDPLLCDFWRMVLLR